ncbi:ISKra4 family transposase [Arthrospira platensis SPKY1]|nr:ISKra4 family transposase [Arthrospira platensis SPKY1]
MSKLSELTGDYIRGSHSIAEMEKGYLSQVLSLCLSLLRFVISAKLSALMGSAPPATQAGKRLDSKGQRPRKYLSLFGMLEFERPAYHSKPTGMVYPLDEALSLPALQWSYNIQELTAQSASETDFRESVGLLNNLLGLGLSGTASERNAGALGRAVDSFYAGPPAEDGPGGAPQDACFCASFDGKGVPKIKPWDKQAAPPSARLGKGQKRGVKQMATVAVVSRYERAEQGKSSIIRALMREHEPNAPEGQDNDNRRHKAVHRRGFLADQDRAVSYGLARAKARISHAGQRLVVPIDAGIGLESKVLHYVKEYGLEGHFEGIILDFIHASEYVWDCANATLGEDSRLRKEWVRDMLSDLLDSKTRKVIDDLELLANKCQSLTKGQRATVQKAATYFANHAHKMDYKSYLEKGYPVTSAIVESSCKHLVKDRMEQSGMRWCSEGAQAMMDVRAAKLNGDLPELMSFVDQQQRKSGLLRAA